MEKAKNPYLSKGEWPEQSELYVAGGSVCEPTSCNTV